ncbi:hypothetical protein BLNAU_8505 [Blattamonas nauphoetae]|uniref:Uncharacterized protein n=1 Tax=Blattamonas nauphoetae TaxID=2049346 RepID=A0ABQ9XYC0_9EUKA|nr:hypothetical protein BLNAU_8505 [Blattamonas nauphoetae]
MHYNCTSSSDSDRGGSCIYTSDSRVIPSIEGCTFIECSVDSMSYMHGGCIYLYLAGIASSSQAPIVKSCTFTDFYPTQPNSEGYRGGGVGVYYPRASIEITDWMSCLHPTTNQGHQQLRPVTCGKTMGGHRSNFQTKY